jgi:D-3-phosphoglycerate dehydrogenase / 2-oxoglutarate reductase
LTIEILEQRRPMIPAARVLRLNAESFPITSFEREQYAAHQIAPAPMEADSLAELLEGVRDADAVLVVAQALPAEAIDAMRRCRVICRLGAGVDKIDLPAATRQGIVVTNTPTFCVEEQADHAFALLLAAARRLNAMRRCMQEGRYLEGRELSRPLRRLPGRTLGIVGFGGSGRAMARRATGFALRVLATRGDMTRVDPEAERLAVRMVTLPALLAESDFVSLHLPLNPRTQGMFDRQTLARMKSGGVLINTARGGLVDEDALADLLESGHLAAAGLDTFSVVDVHAQRPQPPAHRLFQMENVVFTPHVAAFSLDSSREVADGAVANLVAVLSGRWPPRACVVNPEVTPRSPLADCAGAT